MYNIFEQSLTPYFTFNTMLAKVTESAITQHLTNVEEFTKIGLENFYSGMNARTLEDVVAFSKKQPEIMQKASALLVKRSEGYTDLSNQFYKSTQALFTDNLKNTNKAVNAKYDLGESTVVKKPKKKNTSKSKSSASKNKPAASINAKKKPLASKKARTPVKKKPVEKTVAERKIKPIAAPKQNTAPATAKAPVKKAAVKKAVVENEKGSTPSTNLKS